MPVGPAISATGLHLVDIHFQAGKLKELSEIWSIPQMQAKHSLLTETDGIIN